jgi:hypothetical protein
MRSLGLAHCPREAFFVQSEGRHWPGRRPDKAGVVLSIRRVGEGDGLLCADPYDEVMVSGSPRFRLGFAASADQQGGVTTRRSVLLQNTGPAAC